VLWIRDVYPGSEFFYPGSRIKAQNDSGSASFSFTILNILIQRTDSKLKEKLFGMFIPDSGIKKLKKEPILYPDPLYLKIGNF
jgi:hypothetical protein